MPEPLPSVTRGHPAVAVVIIHTSQMAFPWASMKRTGQGLSCQVLPGPKTTLGQYDFDIYDSEALLLESYPFGVRGSSSTPPKYTCTLSEPLQGKAEQEIL
ncbi:hypothetical protein EYF80_012204 [Liparis tanakae]|uniref:Uncharacterized protein n=1 Tax=Liparis tanakae TaxID=230148 RepID=A0A4Z2IJI1_9TELE|nr:hypothetical protein EYF80_012204 [Liparis tanakae]